MAESDIDLVFRDLSSDHLHKNSVSFKAPSSLKTLEIAEAVTSCGYDDLVSAQLISSKCILTFLSRENAVAISEHGVDIDGNFFEVSLVSEPHVEIKIFDAPIWVPDEQLLSALSAYGTRSGNVRHGFVRTRAGMRIATGVRYVNFRLHQNKTVPSYLKTQARLGKAPVQFRVTHEGQVRTCRHCNHPGHLAGVCPQRSPTRGGANPRSTNSDRTNHDCTLNTNTAPLTTTTGNTFAEVTKNSTPRTNHTTTTRATDHNNSADITDTAPPIEANNTPAATTVTKMPPTATLSTTTTHTTVSNIITGSSNQQPSALPTYTPTLTSLMPISRGKAVHESPDIDEEGFQLARGKHTFQAAINSTQGFVEQALDPAHTDDPQVSWAREDAARNTALIQRNVLFRTRRSSQ